MGDLPVTVNLDAYRGDTWSQTFRLLDGTTPYDLTGATVAASAINGSGTATTLTVDTSGDPGTVTISGPGLAAGVYTYDVQVTDSVSDVLTWIRGQLTVEQDVTP